MGSKMSFNPHNLYLERLTEGEKYRQIRFCKKINVLGRDINCDVALMSSFISGRHCHIEFRNAKMYIRDIKSRNETFVNDSKIIQETELKEGDMIGIGCNPKYLEKLKYRMNEGVLIYKVIKENVVLIELNSSDDEGPNDEVRQSPETRIEKPEEPVSEVVSSNEETEPNKTSNENLSQRKSSRCPSPADLSPEPVEPLREQPEEAFEGRSELESWIDKIFAQANCEEHVSDIRSEDIPEVNAEREEEMTEENDEIIWQLSQICYNHCTETAEQRASNQSRNVMKRALDSPTGAREGKQVESDKDLKRRANDCSGDEERIIRTKKVKLPRGPIIIDAPHLSNRGRGSSVKPFESVTNLSHMPSNDKPFTTRKSSNSSSQHRLAVDDPVLAPEEPLLKNKLAVERTQKQKLRMLQEKEERNRKRKVADEEKAPPRRQSVSHSPKVPPTSYNPKSSKAILLLKLREYMLLNSFKETAILNNLAFYGAELDNMNHSEARKRKVADEEKAPPRRQSVSHSPKVPPTSYNPKSSKAILLLKLREYMLLNSFKETAILNNLAFYGAELDNMNHSEAAPSPFIRPYRKRSPRKRPNRKRSHFFR